MNNIKDFLCKITHGSLQWKKKINLLYACYYFDDRDFFVVVQLLFVSYNFYYRKSVVTFVCELNF